MRRTVVKGGEGRTELDRLAARYFEFSYERDPTSATELGRHEYDDRLPDLSAGALKTYGRELEGWAAEVGALDPTRLTEAAAVDRELILSDIATTRFWVVELEDYRRNPSFYFGEVLFSIFLILSRNGDSPARRARNAAARLEGLPELLAAARANLEHPPRILVEIAMEELEGGLEFCAEVVPAFAMRVPRGGKRLLRAAEGAAEALREFAAFLSQELLLSAHGQLGLGRGAFEKLLRAEHLIEEPAAGLSRRASEVFERTQEEMVELALQIDPGETWVGILEKARHEHPTAGRLLGVYREELKRLQRFIREQDVLTLPEQECEVVETPPFERALNHFAAYVGPGPFEADQRGQFWVTPVERRLPRAEQEELLAEHCNHLYPVTAAHEAYPGHHVQLVRANRAGSHWRKHFASSLFAEGWALYCEQLMADLGYFGDPRTRLFQLRDRLWRAARVMAEIAVHCEGATVEQVARFLVQGVGMSPTMARAETQRYAAEPTQPLSYLIGELEVLKLRRRFHALPLKQFHDSLLSYGTIPFKLVEREMAALESGGEEP